MTERRELIREAVAGQDACYLPDLYEAECETARRIAAMAQTIAVSQTQINHPARSPVIPPNSFKDMCR